MGIYLKINKKESALVTGPKQIRHTAFTNRGGCHFTKTPGNVLSFVKFHGY
jgi:hypothetical protein